MQGLLPNPPRFLDSNQRLRPSNEEQYVFVANVQGVFTVVQVHNPSEAQLLDVTLRTIDPHKADVLRRRMSIPEGYPLRVWYNRKTKTCIPNKLGTLYEAAQRYLVM